MPAKPKLKIKMKPKAKRGRPPTPIDLDVVKKLANIQATDPEIAAWLGMTEEGFRLRKNKDGELLGVLKKGRADGRSSLRRMQFQTAEKGNPTMQIWLGKQLLGQRDKIEQEIDTTVNIIFKQPTERE